jgi:molybdate transport system substrate-binding protein
MKWLTFAVPLACLLLHQPGCQQSAPHAETKAPSQRVVTIAAAADLKFALDEIITEFARVHPEIVIRPTYGSSGNFYAQLTNEAPYDLYLSADIEYPRRLAEQGLTIPDSEFQYAIGQLVVWVRHDSALPVEQQGLRSLLEPQIRRIAIANPQHAPYGRAAVAALQNAQIHEQVQERFVLGENIAQTAQFVQSGSADVGILALSLALAPTLKSEGRYWQIPNSLHPPIEQGGVILKWAQDLDATNLFREYLLSPEGRAVLDRFGFLLPAAP